MSDRIQTLRHPWRFALVLLATLLLAVVQPLTAGVFTGQFYLAVLVAGTVGLKVTQAMKNEALMS